jgi:hypothetical protein
MMMNRMRLALLVVATVAACGGAASDIGKAKASAYNTEFATVWNAVVAEMHDRYHDDGIRVEDAEKGYVESKWKKVEVTQDSTLGDSDQRLNKTAGAIKAGLLMRTLVKVMPGGPPWQIAIDGEAAQFRPELASLTPFKHGAIDEPHWVPGRIDGLRAAIHERLKAFAVDAPAGAAAPPAPAADPAPAK